MRQPESLSHEELVALVRSIRDVLYLDEGDHSDADTPNAEDGARFLNPEKEWDVETIEEVAERLAACDLVPTEPTPVPEA